MAAMDIRGIDRQGSKPQINGNPCKEISVWNRPMKGNLNRLNELQRFDIDTFKSETDGPS